MPQRLSLSLSLSLSLLALASLAPLAVGCAPAPCEHLTDCPGTLVCASDGRCVADDGLAFLGGSGGGARVAGRATPGAGLEGIGADGGFAGNINGTEFTDPNPSIEGSSEGYVAYQLTSEVAGGAVGMWFDIPVPDLLPVGTPRVFTLEEMFADGSMPCIQLWSEDGTSAWADDYTMTQFPEDANGDVLLAIEATNATSAATATLTIPALQ